jgi:hypothetical protein
MKPDLTLLTDGFTAHKEIKFTNLVPLPTPVDSTRSELFFFIAHFGAVCKSRHRNKKSNQVNQNVVKSTKLDLKLVP